MSDTTSKKNSIFRQSGKVRPGIGLAKVLGFPTANIYFDSPDLSGTYAGQVYVDKISYRAAVYVNQNRKLLEAYIFDFGKDLYGKEITIELFEKVAAEEKLESNEDLQKKIENDIAQVKKYFGL